MRATILVWAAIFLANFSSSAPARPPNIVLIVADDLGYADLGVQGGKDVPTPHIDALANAGMRFTNAYASGCVCSPSRVGLLTGRYQNRTGHDANPRRNLGLDLKEVTLAQRLKELGYKTGMVGKWHLGDSPEEHPLSRGFDEFYGILPHGIGAGERQPEGEAVKEVVVYRNREPTERPADHTVAFGQEAVAFVERHKDEPFVLYLPFTAVHSPHLSPKSYGAKVAHVADPRRRRYLAMLATLDDMVGNLREAIRKHKLEEHTLVAFMSDNGGPDGAPNNGLLRGGKWTLWEGGIRSPLFVAWPGHIAPGGISHQPAIQIDLAPTVLAAAGDKAKPEWELDGVNLLPLLTDNTTTLDRDAIYWRFGVQFAVRQGNWKLVKPSLDDKPLLFNLATDAGEANDLAAEQPERVRALTSQWEKWNAGNIPPRWDDARWNGAEARKARKQAKKGKTKA